MSFDYTTFHDSKVCKTPLKFMSMKLLQHVKPYEFPVKENIEKYFTKKYFFPQGNHEVRNHQLKKINKNKI